MAMAMYAPGTLCHSARAIHDTEVINDPITIAVNERMRRVSAFKATVQVITMIGSVMRIHSVLAFASTKLCTNGGRIRYCCQKTTQYPEKISRKSTNRQFLTTVKKLLTITPTVGTVSPCARRGSLKKISTAISIRK